MSDNISIEGLDKAKVLCALYNASRPQGMGFMSYKSEPMSSEEARRLLEERQRFDYVNGRVLKVDLSKNEFSTYAYDRDNGSGAAKMAVDSVRENQGENSAVIQAIHITGRKSAANEIDKIPDEVSPMQTDVNTRIMEITIPKKTKDKIKDIIKNIDKT